MTATSAAEEERFLIPMAKGAGVQLKTGPKHPPKSTPAAATKATAEAAR